MTSTTFPSAAGLTLLINLISIWFSEHRSAFHVILWILLVCLLVYLLFTVVIPLILGIISLFTDDDESELERQLESLEEDDDEEPVDPEAAKVTDLSAYWYCERCGKMFRNYSGDLPEYCPSCGHKARIVPIEKMREEYNVFFCPRCGEMFNISDGSTPRKCSRCGWEPDHRPAPSEKEPEKKDQ